MKQLKLGSLFDGSGGFPLAGVMNGIEPVWASEIEPFPIRVTKQRFPNMKHLGSVTDINGAEIEPVDIITFGSPCQDLSVAGKQAGIHDGERSSLFFEAVRIIREMREHDRATGRADVDIRPRFAVWENVPGAFSSNHGEDFKAVLQALCEIEGGQGVSVPMPSKGKWFPAGCIVGNGYSIAWRVYDAQYWGVPQRRKRIYLIADFGSERAGEILFESESVPGDHQPGNPQGQGTSEDAEGSAGRSDNAFNESGVGYWMPGFGCLRAEGENRPSRPNHVVVKGGVKCLNPWDCQSKRQYSINGVYRTLDAGNSAGGQAHGVCYAVTTKGNGDAFLNPDTHTALQTGGGEARQGYPCVCYSIEGNTVDRDTKKNDCGYCQDVSPTLNTQDKHAVTYAIEGNGQRESHKGDGFKETDTMYTLNATENHAVCYPDVAKTLTARYDSSPCIDRGQNIICYGVDCRNGCLNEEKTITIQAKPGGGVSLNCTPSVVYGVSSKQQSLNVSHDIANTLGANDFKEPQMTVYGIENHPADSRVNLTKDDKCQTLTSRMGTGGGNVPMILEIKDERE